MPVKIWKNDVLLSSTHWDSGNGRVLEAMLNGEFCSENGQTYSKPVSGDVFELEAGTSIDTDYGMNIKPHGAAGVVTLQTRGIDAILWPGVFMTKSLGNTAKSQVATLSCARFASPMKFTWLKADGTQETQKHANWRIKGIHFRQDWTTSLISYPHIDFGVSEDGYLGAKLIASLLPDNCEVDRCIFTLGAGVDKSGPVVNAPHGNGFYLHNCAFIDIRQNASRASSGDYYCIGVPYNLNNDGTSWCRIEDNFMECGGEGNFFGYGGEGYTGHGTATQVKRVKFLRNWVTRDVSEWWSQYSYNAGTLTFLDTSTDPGNPNWPIPSTYTKVKNLWEAKSIQSIFIVGNFFENCWRSADQPAGCIVPSLRDESGNPYAVMKDIHVYNNIFSNAQVCLSALAYDEGWDTNVTNRAARFPPTYDLGTGHGPGRGLYMVNNLFIKCGIKAWPDSPYMVLLVRGYQDVIFEHNTVMCQNNVPYQIGFAVSYDHLVNETTWPGKAKADLIVRNNAFCLASQSEWIYGFGRKRLFHADTVTGFSPSEGWDPGTSRIKNLVFSRNIIGGGSVNDGGSDWPTAIGNDNYVTTNHATYKSEFVGYDSTPIDPRLAGSSQGKNNATDGSDVGCNLQRIYAAMGQNLYRQAGVVIP